MGVGVSLPLFHVATQWRFRAPFRGFMPIPQLCDSMEIIMLSRSESIRRHIDVSPFKHPHFETFRDRQKQAFVRELADAVRQFDAMRERLQSRRILESLQ